MTKNIRVHITIPQELDNRIRKFGEENNMIYSHSVRKIIENGLNNMSVNNQLEMYNTLMNKLFTRQLYIRDLLEQFYTDMEIEKLLNPKNNKALQQFKSSKIKDIFSD